MIIAAKVIINENAQLLILMGLLCCYAVCGQNMVDTLHAFPVEYYL